MQDLDEELWKLGIYSKTKHNEVAPSQHEMAPVYCDCNTACDQNQLTMDIMKKVADRHGLVCLLHEKPFAGVNGSGKHDNWSLSTDSGENLFAPGKTPSQNAQFLLFLTAFIEGVDEYQELLRSTVAFAGNDHRLGAQEAPPAVISIYLGDELSDVIDSIIGQTDYTDRKRARFASAWTFCPRFRRTRPTATAPRLWPSRATSLSSVCWARASPFPAPTSSSTRSWQNRSANTRTFWKRPRILRRRSTP